MDGLILFEKFILIFLIYSFGGWIVEEINCSIKEKKLVNRGFLIGPICPIYGFGGVIMTIYLTQFIERPIMVFIVAVIASAILEYFTSYVMEKIFNARWWDYSNNKFNLNGRICLRTLIPFGIFGLIVIYILNPKLFEMIEALDSTTLAIISWTGLVVTLIDFFVSMSVISKVTSTAEQMSKENPKDDTNEITKKVKDELKKTFTGKRLVNAFPDFTALSTKLKEVAEKSKKVAENTVKKGKEAAENTVKKGKEAAEKTVRKGKEAAEKTAQKSKEVAKKTVEKGKKVAEETAKRVKKQQ